MEKFNLRHQIEKVLRGENTSFLNPINARYITNTLKDYNCNYNTFLLFKDTEKIIIYQNKLEITLFEIESKEKLTHQEILGSLFSHNLKEDTFGDIIITENKYYIVALNRIKKYLLNNYNKIGNKKIKLVEKNLNEVSSYQPKYKKNIIQISSLRIDNVVSKLIPTSRKIAKEYISSQKIILNYNILKNTNYILKEKDIFSIKRVGKFKFDLIIATTKTGKYQIQISKYI